MNKLQRNVLIVSIMATFVINLDGFIVNVALPAIAKELGGGLLLEQWVVNAYLITLGAFMLIAGSLSDLFGRKKILQIGLVAFAITSLMCAVAPDGVFLTIARALQGVAGALLGPSSLALIIATFSGSKQGKAIGVWTAWTAIAPAVAPLIGGLLIDFSSWRLIFAINLLPVAISLWFISRIEVPENIRSKTKVDILGALLCAVGLGSLVYAFIEQPRFGWDHPLIYTTLLVGVAALISFIAYERYSSHPMLPLKLFKVRNFGIGNIATAAIYAGLSLSTFLLTIFLQQIGHYSAIQAGLALMPVIIIMFTLSSVFGTLSGKYGPRLFMALGPIIASGGFLLLASVDASINYWTHIFPGIVIFGLGLSITVAPLTSAILGSIHPSQSGIGSAINNAVARIAGLIAIAIIGIVMGSHLTLSGFKEGMLLVAALLLVGGVISAIGITNKPAKAPEL